MTTTQLTKQGLLRRSFKALLAGAMAAFLFLGVSAWANIIPDTLPPNLICFNDVPFGSPSVTTSNLSVFATIGYSILTQPYGPETAGINLLTTFQPPLIGTTFTVILTNSTGTAKYLLWANATQQVGDISDTIIFEDSSATNFSALVAANLGGADTTELAITGSQQNLSVPLDTGELVVCFDCTTNTVSVPDTTSTVSLFGLALTATALVYRRTSRARSVVR